MKFYVPLNTLLLNVVPNFYRIVQNFEPHICWVRRVRWCVHTGQYIGSLKQTLFFFSYFYMISLNRYSFFPIFILYQCFLQIFKLVTYFLGVYIGGGVGEMDIWSRNFAEKFHIIFNVCVCTDREREGGSGKCQDRCG